MVLSLAVILLSFLSLVHAGIVLDGHSEEGLVSLDHVGLGWRFFRLGLALVGLILARLGIGLGQGRLGIRLALGGAHLGSGQGNTAVGFGIGLTSGGLCLGIGKGDTGAGLGVGLTGAGICLGIGLAGGGLSLGIGKGDTGVGLGVALTSGSFSLGIGQGYTCIGLGFGHVEIRLGFCIGLAIGGPGLGFDHIEIDSVEIGLVRDFDPGNGGLGPGCGLDRLGFHAGLGEDRLGTGDRSDTDKLGFRLGCEFGLVLFLPGDHGRRRRNRLSRNAFGGPGRQPDAGARRNAGVALDDGVAPGRIQVVQLINGEPVITGKLLGRHGLLKDQAIVVVRLVKGNAVGEVFFGIARDLAGGDELRIEIARIEAKGVALVILDDLADVAAMEALGLGDAALAVVVGGDGQGPATQFAMGRGQITGRPLAGQ